MPVAEYIGDLLYHPNNLIHFVGIKDFLPDDVQVGATCLCGQDNQIYIKTDNDKWEIICQTGDIINHEDHTHPSICSQCGAPLNGHVCKYCGTKY